jgi:lysophospholipase L1-like esterase
MKTLLQSVLRPTWFANAIIAAMMLPPGSNADGPAVPAESAAGRRIAITDSSILLAPYAWKCTGSGPAARAEAALPGAYFKTVFQGSSAIRLLVDGTANTGCPPAAMPVTDYSLDGRAYQTVRLGTTGQVYAVPLAVGLETAGRHRLELHFRAAGLGPARWEASTVHLRIAGIELEAGGSLLPCPERAKKAIGFGDSITEGVCVEGLCPFYSNLLMNNARATWFPVVCAALDCEYGQLGTGGQGMVVPRALPPLSQTWDHFDATTSRLEGGRLRPEPDYVFCCMGTNDFEDEGGRRKQRDITAACIAWLAAGRQGCPNARFFCVVPPLGWHASEWTAAVKARRQAGDHRVHLIDTAPLEEGFAPQGATQFAPDGVHPSCYGNAMLGAFVAVQAQKIVSEAQAR